MITTDKKADVKNVQFAPEPASSRKSRSLKDDPKLMATLSNPDFWAKIVETAVTEAFEQFRADDTNETYVNNSCNVSLDLNGSFIESPDSSLGFSSGKSEAFVCSVSAECCADDHGLAHLGA